MGEANVLGHSLTEAPVLVTKSEVADVIMKIGTTYVQPSTLPRGTPQSVGNAGRDSKEAGETLRNLPPVTASNEVRKLEVRGYRLGQR